MALLSRSFQSIFLCAGLLFAGSTYAQKPVLLDPIVEHFELREIGTDSYIRGICEDDQGFIYTAFRDQIFRFDGNRWEAFKVDSVEEMYTLKVIDGRLYVGGKQAIGYAEVENGDLVYHSLIPQLPDNAKGFYFIWDIEEGEDEIWFRSYNCLLKLQNDTLEAISDGGFYHSVSPTSAETWVRVHQQGLYTIDDSQLVKSEHFPEFEQIAVAGIYQLSPDTTMIISRQHGLFWLAGSKEIRQELPLDSRLQQAILFTSIMLDDGNIAVGTMRDGVLILNRQGEILRHFSSDNHFPSVNIHSLAQAKNGDLWVSGNRGLSRIRYPESFTFSAEPPLSLWDGDDIAVVEGKAYVATPGGMFQFTPKGFQLLDNGRLNARRAQVIGNTLYVSCAEGIFTLKNGNLRQISNQMGVRFVARSEANNQMYLASYSGVSLLSESGSKQIFQGYTEKVFEVDSGELILLTRNDDWIAWKEGTSDTLIDPGTERPLRGQFLGNIASNLLFVSSDGRVIHLNKQGKETAPISSLVDLFPQLSGSLVIQNAKSLGPASFGILCKSNETHWYLEVKIAGTAATGVHAINLAPLTGIGAARSFAPSKDQLWISGSQGVGLLSMASITTSKIEPPILGSVYSPLTDTIYSYFPDSDIQADSRSIGFSFGNPHRENRYRYRLMGFLDEWSPFSEITQKEYDNLPGGNYTFEVSAQSPDGEISPTTSIRISVPYPWFLQWYMIGLYVLGFGIVIRGAMGWRTRNLRKKQLELEQALDDRTRELKTKTQRLEEIDKTKNDIIANITHEFRTPLNLILEPARDLISGKQEVSKNADIIYRNAGQLNELVDKLFELTRLDSGKVNLELSETNFITLVQRTVESFDSLAQQKEITLSFISEVEDIQDASLLIDEEKTTRVLNNLLSNALKFTPEKGQVEVAFSLIVDQVCIQVSDNGPGVGLKDADRIFERFEQAETAERGGGIGIGLALSKELALLMGGDLVLNSSQEGASFLFTTPRIHAAEYPQVAHQEGQENTTVNPDQRPANRQLILIAEDKPEFRKYLEEQLSEKYEVLGVSGGHEAYEVAKKYVPDLVLTDLMMPVGNGIELATAIKNDPALNHIPVLLLTANPQDEIKYQGLKSGADEYLQKPITSTELHLRIESMLANREKLRTKYRQEAILGYTTAEESLSPEEQFVKQVNDIIQKRFSDEHFSVSVLADQLFMSRRQLQRKIGAISGHSPSGLIRTIRLQKAKEMIGRQSVGVSEACFACGFKNVSHFSALFKAEFGMLPSEV